MLDRPLSAPEVEMKSLVIVIVDVTDRDMRHIREGIGMSERVTAQAEQLDRHIRQQLTLYMTLVRTLIVFPLYCEGPSIVVSFGFVVAEYTISRHKGGEQVPL